jgi:hypothetical protein
MQVRQATLDDTQAIVRLFCAKIPRWQRINAQGQVEDLPYAALTIYERWLHGGAWLSLETAALWLSHLLHGAGTPLVLLADQQIIGYAEVYQSDEPAPFNAHLYLADFVLADDAPADATESLMQAVLERASKSHRLIAACSAFDVEKAGFYQRYGLQSLGKVQHVTVTAQTGQAFYKATDHLTAHAAQIAGWGMPIGRITDARHQWETLWHSHWDAVPQIVARQTHRLHFSVSGQDAFVCLQQQLYDPRSVDVYCWTPKLFSMQLLAAIRDRAHRMGYRTLVMAVMDKVAHMIGTEAESAPYQQEIFYREV